MTESQRRQPRLRAALCALLAGGGLAVSVSPASAQDAGAYREEAAAAVSAGRYVDALAAHARAIDAVPDDPAGYAARAQLFVLLGHADLAARDYGAAVKLKPGDAGSQGNLCLMLALSNHDLDGALAACDAAVRLEPANHDALARRGYVQLRRGAYAEAERDFTAALALNPAGPDEMFGLGLAMIHAGRAQQGRDIIASATLDSASLVNEWEARGFGLRGEILPGKSVTTAAQPIATLNATRVFVNRGEEALVGLAPDDGCGRIVPPARGADWSKAVAANARLHWSGECRFGLVHADGRLSDSPAFDGPAMRFAYGREIVAGEAGAALAETLRLAYGPAEAALAP